MPANRSHEVEKIYSTRRLAVKLRRLADALEEQKAFSIQVAGKRIRVPAEVRVSIEHEREEGMEELEFQLQWPTRGE